MKLSRSVSTDGQRSDHRATSHASQKEIPVSAAIVFLIAHYSGGQ